MRRNSTTTSTIRCSSTIVSTKSSTTLPLLRARKLPPAQLWLPLAVPPCFLVNGHHNTLTLPILSQCKDTSNTLIKRIFYLNVAYMASRYLSASIGHHWTHEKRGFFTFQAVVVPATPTPTSQPRQTPSSSQQSLQKRTLPCMLNM